MGPSCPDVSIRCRKNGERPQEREHRYARFSADADPRWISRQRRRCFLGYPHLARLIPEAAPSGSPNSERVVLDAMRGLSGDWTVMYDVPVGLFGRPRADLRQIDFLLLHEKLGIFVFEVKGGGIRVERGTWLTLPFGRSEWVPLARSPFKQVADQHYTLERWLRERVQLERQSICHGVIFPGSDVPGGDLGPDAPHELAVGRGDLRNLELALVRVRNHWGPTRGLTRSELKTVTDALRPSFTMRVLSATKAADSLAGLDRETRRQADMVQSQVEAYRTLLSSERLVVLGGAGTGKTVIASELAKHHESLGNKTLLICHRATVRSFLMTLLNVPGSMRSFHAGLEGNLHVATWQQVSEAVGPSHGDDLSEKFLEFRDSLGRPYDVIVVDEGQEFDAAQLDALTWLLDDPTASPLYVFADPFQHSGIHTTPLRDRMEKRVTFRWTNPIAAPQVVLTENCRNTRPIAELAAAFYPEDPPRPLVDGHKPQFHRAPAGRVLDHTLDLVSTLLENEGFSPNQILVVLVGIPLPEAESAARRAGVSAVSAVGLYRFPLTPRDLRIVLGRPDEVQGLESDVTVVAIGSDDQASTPRELYVALSRARAELHVVSPWTREKLLRLAAGAAPIPAVAE